MKFKLIFLLFSLTLLLFLAFFLLVPYIMLGSLFSASYWRMNWLILAVWALFFFSFNVFYFINRKLFILLEKEDWPALIDYLEDKVIQKGRYSPRLVRLLANSYLVLSDSASVMNFENKLAIAKPALIDANMLIFGTARILGQDIHGALRFFKNRKDTVKKGLKDWADWYYGFALLLNRQFHMAADEFSVLAQFSRDGVVTALSSFFMSETIAPFIPEREPEIMEIAAKGRERVCSSMPKIENWRREVSRISSEIHAAAISKYMEEAGRWLYL